MKTEIIVRIVLRGRTKTATCGSVYQVTGGSGVNAWMGGVIEKDVMRSGTVSSRMRSVLDLDSDFRYISEPCKHN